MTAKDSEALLKALVGVKKEIDAQAHQELNLMKSHLVKHPCDDEDIEKRADYYATFLNRAIGTMPKHGGSLFGVRRLLAKRFESVCEDVADLQSKPRTVDRWCRVCGLITEMILLSDKENDHAFVFADGFRTTLDLLKEGAMHNPDGKGASAFALNREEQNKIVDVVKEIVQTWWISCSRLGLDECWNEDALSYEDSLSDRFPGLKKVKVEDRPYSILFQGDRKSATLSIPAVVDATNFIKMIPTLVVDNTWFDLLLDADLVFSFEWLYCQFLLARTDLSLRGDNPRRGMMELQPRIKYAINSSIEKVVADESSAEAKSYKFFKEASDRRLLSCLETVLKLITKLGFKDFEEAVKNEDFGLILAKCLNVDPDVFLRQRDLTKDGIKGMSIARGIKRRGDSAHLDDDLSGMTLFGEKPGCMLGILDNGATVSWMAGRCRKTCDLSAKLEVNLFGRLFRASLNGSSGLDANLVYVTSVLWGEVKRTAKKRGKYAVKKAKCNKEKEAAKKSLASLNQFFAEVVICDSKKGKRRYDEVPERQIVKKGNEKPKFVYRAYLNPLYVSRGACLPQK